MTLQNLLRFFSVLICMLFFDPVNAEEARYEVVVSLDWQVAEGQSPASPHWSRLIAFAHSTRYSLFRDGDTASSGLALIATNGRLNVIEAELAEGRRRMRVGEQVVLAGLPDGQGRFEFEITLTERMRALSFATMLAPSPDWFTGASGLLLMAEDEWLDELRAPLWVWDAGADSGLDFKSANAPSQPRQSVRLLTHSSFLRPEGLKPIGHVWLRRQK